MAILIAVATRDEEAVVVSLLAAQFREHSLPFLTSASRSP